MNLHREFCLQYINVNNLDVNNKDIYAFGVYNGKSLIYLKKKLDEYKIKVNGIYGFDSFKGLPEMDENHDLWKPGMMNAMEYFKVDSVREAVDKVSERLDFGNNTVELIPGYFKDSLLEKIVQGYKMKTACLVDIDVDLYQSAYEALDFMFQNKLIRKNTLILYDDWGGDKQYKGGESKAHLDIKRKYDVNLKQIFSCEVKKPHKKKVFVVK